MFKKRKLKKEAYSIDHSDTVLKYIVGNMALEILTEQVAKMHLFKLKNFESPSPNDKQPFVCNK